MYVNFEKVRFTSCTQQKNKIAWFLGFSKINYITQHYTSNIRKMRKIKQRKYIRSGGSASPSAPHLQDIKHIMNPTPQTHYVPIIDLDNYIKTILLISVNISMSFMSHPHLNHCISDPCSQYFKRVNTPLKIWVISNSCYGPLER